MRVSPPAHASLGLLCGFLVLVAGCNNPASQSLDSLTITATPTTLAVGGASVLKATAHLSDGSTQDVTAGAVWTSSNNAMASVANGTLTARAVGTVTVAAAYVETVAASDSVSATVSKNLNASAQVTITATDGTKTPNGPGPK